MIYLAALLVTCCYMSGVILRYMPFRELIGKQQRDTVYLIYGCLMLVNFLVVSVVLRGYGLSMDLMQIDGVVFSTVLLLVNVFLIPGRTREHLFVYGIVVTFNYILMAIPKYWCGVYNQGRFILAALVMYGVLLMATFFPLKKLLINTVKPFLSVDSGDYWSAVWYIPICMFVAMFFICPGDGHADTINHLISHGLIGFVTLAICWAIAADHKRLWEREAMVYQLNLQKSHYESLQERVADARKRAHDFKHHIAAIQHYIDTDDRDGLQAYCWDLSEDSATGVAVPYTGNNAVDGVMFRYAKLAKEHRVDFEYVGSIQGCAMQDIELCVLLGNALDNALTACLHLKQNRLIKVIMQAEEHMLSILVHNTFDGHIQQKQDVLYSRKRDNEPGIGMSSMNSICDRYGATMDVQWDEETFTVLFVIPA